MTAFAKKTNKMASAIKIQIPITKSPEYGALPNPTYATEHSAGMDLLAVIPEPLLLKPLARALIPTGISLALPCGYEAQVRPRSGLAIRHGITVLNSPGTIDADYRGEIKVILINLGQEEFWLTKGMRIAQMVFAPISLGQLQEVQVLEATARGDGGFGHSGL